MPRSAASSFMTTVPEPTPDRPAVSALLRALAERRRRRALSLRHLSPAGAGG